MALGQLLTPFLFYGPVSGWLFAEAKLFEFVVAEGVFHSSDFREERDSHICLLRQSKRFMAVVNGRRFSSSGGVEGYHEKLCVGSREFLA